MAEKLSGVIEHTATATTVTLASVSFLGWINHNAQAIVAICAVITCVVGIIAAIFRHVENKKQTAAITQQRRRASDHADLF